MNDLRTAAQQALEKVQEFKRRWLLVPAFGNKVNKTTREAITNAHSPIFELEHALRAALAQRAEPYRLPDDLYGSTDWRAGTYAERVEWPHAMYESAKKERDALLYPPEPLWPPTGLEPRGCPMPGACSCPSESVRSTHSEDCWQWHQACAVAEVERLRKALGGNR